MRFRPLRLQYLAFCRRMSVSVASPSWVPKFQPVGPDESQAASFRIVSYNILAQAYVKSVLFPHSPAACLKWKNRSQKVLSRLLSLDADFLCVQELDEYESFYKRELESKGYSSIYVQRGGKKRDGCGIFYKSSICELLQKDFIDYNDLVPPAEGAVEEDDGDDRDVSNPRIRLRRNCVGILAAFRHSRCPNEVIIVANTHLYWDPALIDVKLAQAKYLLWRLVQFQKDTGDKFDREPLVFIAGDFNSTPGDQVYNYITSGKAGEAQADDIAGLLNLSKGPSIGLNSLYAAVQGEPVFTNLTPEFTGTLDYIFVLPDKRLQAKALLELPAIDSADVVGGLPNHSHPSDHLPIGADILVVL